MTTFSIPDHARTLRETSSCALAALDELILNLGLKADNPIATILEAQREVLLSLGRLSEVMAEVGEVQSDVLKSPERPSDREAVRFGHP